MAPIVTCPSPEPVFQLHQIGAWVNAAVTDATSGAARALVQGATVTSVAGTFATTATGSDRAGHRTSATCTYVVAGPTCNGLAATIVGTGANNIITGTAGSDVIVALAGADTINGKGGDDVICGGDGPDVILGGDGKDWIDGGASNDELEGGDGDDYLDGGAGSDGGRDTCLSGERRTSSCEA